VKPFTIDDKRLHLPAAIESKCPKCGKKVKVDFSYTSSLNFPRCNEPMVYTMYHTCSDDDDDFQESEWEVTIQLNVELVAVEGCAIRAVKAS
jgi:rRNA maturation protein Nop10